MLGNSGKQAINVNCITIVKRSDRARKGKVAFARRHGVAGAEQISDVADVQRHIVTKKVH